MNTTDNLSEIEAGPSSSTRIRSTSIAQNESSTPSRLYTSTTQNRNYNYGSISTSNDRSLNIGENLSLTARNNKTINLIRPYPIFLPLVIDLIYTIRSFSTLLESKYYVVLGISMIRISTISYIVTCKSWKFKKSLIVLVIGLTLINSIWEGCKKVLMRSIMDHGVVHDDSNSNEAGGEGKILDISSEDSYLIYSSILAIIEYLSYLILLRISPPQSSLSGLNKPYQKSSIRLPATAHQTPSSMRFHTRSRSRNNTPGSVRFDTSLYNNNRHKRHVSRGTLRSIISNSDQVHEVDRDALDVDGRDVFTSSTEIGSSGYKQGQLARRSLDQLHQGLSENIGEDMEGVNRLNNRENHHEFGSNYDYKCNEDDKQSDCADHSEDDEEEEDHLYYRNENDHINDEQYSLNDFDENSDDYINYEEEDYDDHDNNNHDDEDEYDPETSSSISSSSIIDLPKSLSPSLIPISKLTLPRSTSLNLHLNVQLDNSPILGPIVRRTRSARFLKQNNNKNPYLGGSSWKSDNTTNWLSSQQQQEQQQQQGFNIDEEEAAAGGGEFDQQKNHQLEREVQHVNRRYGTFGN
ncbi:uncharacterized protein L201_004249 [Kwoniella dendrophila CBS 6074]|uniref:DUF1746 domain-containing protein n=1 Tax=Kwoniella dendrophila CBS 6074 TaxID=1295534 RepID=A0AAX4JWP6_9TREE